MRNPLEWQNIPDYREFTPICGKRILWAGKLEENIRPAEHFHGLPF
jgi:hypothetical protein